MPNRGLLPHARGAPLKPHTTGLVVLWYRTCADLRRVRRRQVYSTKLLLMWLLISSYLSNRNDWSSAPHRKSNNIVTFAEHRSGADRSRAALGGIRCLREPCQVREERRCLPDEKPHVG